MATETIKTLKFDTSNLATKGESIISFSGSYSYASLETVNAIGKLKELITKTKSFLTCISVRMVSI